MLTSHRLCGCRSLFHDDDEDDDDAAARYGFFARGGAAAKGDSKGKTPPRAKEKGRDRTRSDFISVDPVKTGNADGGGGGEAVMAADKAQPAAAGASPRRDSQLLEKKQKVRSMRSASTGWRAAAANAIMLIYTGVWCRRRGTSCR